MELIWKYRFILPIYLGYINEYISKVQNKCNKDNSRADKKQNIRSISSGFGLYNNLFASPFQ
jgi:hypothetical protein